MLRVYILMISLLSSVASAELLDDATLARIRQFRMDERLAATLEAHESRVLLHHDENDKPIKTQRSVLLISGLFNSPKAMTALETSFFERGYNVVNLRLAGHYEKDTSVLREYIQWSMWREQSQEAFALARALGEDSVMMAGHSTGALLVTWLAVEWPEYVSGLALFAPAFALSPALETFLAMNANIHFKTMRGRTLTAHAGREVRELGLAFTEAMTRDCSTSLEYVGERLANVPVWMGNSGFDHIIDLGAANEFYEALVRAGRAKRHFKTLAPTNFILHDTLVSGTHWRWPALHGSMNRTLFPE